MTRDDRLRQLLEQAWRLVREEGTDALSLGRLAEQAGVTKPVVYDHFGTRAGLLAALYQDFDARQSVVMDARLAASGPTLAEKAQVIADAYVACVIKQGREIPGVMAALAGSPELARIKREYDVVFLEQCPRCWHRSRQQMCWRRPGCGECWARPKDSPLRQLPVTSHRSKRCRSWRRRSRRWSRVAERIARPMAVSCGERCVTGRV